MPNENKLNNTHYVPGLVLPLIVLVVLTPVGVVIFSAFGFLTSRAAYNGEQIIRQAETIPGLLEDKVLTRFQIPNPHWNKAACIACHADEPDGSTSPLKTPSDGSCYYCHTAQEHIAIHPVDLKPAKEMLTRMPKEFRQKLVNGNETNCITCHNILMQCTSRATMMRLHNVAFLRGGGYRTETGVCYRCHDKSAYKKLNPHDQVNDRGEIEEDKCLLCHRDIPLQISGNDTADVTLQIDSNWSELCLNCHRWEPHPGGSMSFSGRGPPEHLVVPDPKMLERMLSTTQQNNLDLPLEPGSGKIYCATCHNPHERGVIRKKSLAKGADEKNRLRSTKLCLNCHDK